MTGKQQVWIVCGVLGALAVDATWNVSGLFEAQANAQYAAEDLEACQQLAAAIESLRSQSSMAAAEEMGDTELGEWIDEAKRAAGLADGVVRDRIPQEHRRVGESPYVVEPTLLTLRGVSMPQLVTFLCAMTDESGLRVRDLRVRVPVGGEASNLWDADITLTYLIYSPAEADAGNRRNSS